MLHMLRNITQENGLKNKKSISRSRPFDEYMTDAKCKMDSTE